MVKIINKGDLNLPHGTKWSVGESRQVSQFWLLLEERSMLICKCVAGNLDVSFRLAPVLGAADPQILNFL